MRIQLRAGALTLDDIKEITISIDGINRGYIKLKEEDIKIFENIIAQGIMVINKNPVHKFIPTTSC